MVEKPKPIRRPLKELPAKHTKTRKGAFFRDVSRISRAKLTIYGRTNTSSETRGGGIFSAAANGEPARCDHRSNRHRQNRDAAARLAEGFSQRGVPVFMADIKGDLTGISQPGSMTGKIGERLTSLGFTDVKFEGSPVTLWDVFGKQGHPLRATVSEMGPLLLSRILQLNDTQEGVLTIAFKVADENGLLLARSQGPAVAAAVRRGERR